MIHNYFLELPKQHKIIISVCTIIFVLLLILPSEKATAGRQTQDTALEIGKRYQLPVPQNSLSSAESEKTQASNTNVAVEADDENKKNEIDEVTEDESELFESYTWDTAKVKSGDSLAKILKRLGYSPRTTHELSIAKGKDSKLLQKLNIGDQLHIAKDESGKLVALTYPLSKTDTLYVNWNTDHYESHVETKTVEIRETTAHGIIKSNFWSAGIEAGLDDAQIINLANIFGWDIDFALDIRSGDSFHVVYENKYIDGEFIGAGKILAAEFVNQNEPFQAIRFTDGEYYSATGKSMRKAFLRAPVNFRYISSNFKPKRFHPIQKKWKAHNGTDYRAKTGTPVVAAGNGKVIQSAYNKYNGNYVFIQHGNDIVTKYLHFSKRKVKKGQRVKQGDVIGYVGSTGMSEAPHLHYEFLLNGVHRNPRTVKLPNANPLAKKDKAEFAMLAEQRLAELAGSRQVMLSMQETQSNQ
ncbi:peptidoglycan DD-metalloendopeptidase family protein [Pseudocolwellia sp. AS88]|nr:peptidoglycan DD-metalloendopeptidase family protein [Pseudocolwellia sp. AS88]MDO7086195.1 peptidoglycan DD-metalloendopeptidase family protein [Pseudocolwellia sp. AS88]